ncbi:adenylyl cyclase-associated protein 1-like [Polypterus senegalus]|uniref:adenylyl cyclase-associated protein 1-like n=1 Tax=Polypterus senegalus TaxID=55291 RepID=UPI0019650BFB|nr:adenylyl cyclase-associated protein 1-like [Polypterus senegalus]
MADLERLTERLERAVGQLEKTVLKSGPERMRFGDPAHSMEAGGVSPFVEAFDAFLSGPVEQYCSQSQEIGGDVQKHAEMVKAALNLQRQLLVTASRCQQPSDSELTVLLQPISSKVREVQEFRENNRGSKQFNHLSAISESLPALGWVTMSPKPGLFVKEMKDAAIFYTNRVLKDFKDTDKKQVEWVKSYLNIWSELQVYIKEYHPTGLTWSKTGPKVSVQCLPTTPEVPPVKRNVASSPWQRFTPRFTLPKYPVDPTARTALFAEINQGANITKVLRHVSDDQKPNKNPILKAQAGPMHSAAAFGTTLKPVSSRVTATQKTSKEMTKLPPVLELDGKKWRVENQVDAQELVISNTELKQVVYMFKCHGSTLQIKGKINSITLDNCTKVGLVFDDVVGIVDVINCKDTKIQVMGKVPTISINKTDGCHIYLSKDSTQCEIISAKSSEMNILVPDAQGEFVEIPVPEQFKTVWNGKKLVTTATEMTG